GCGVFAQIGTAATTSAVDGGLPPGSYSYRVRATDAAGNLGPYSNVATAATQDTTSPSAPAALAATAVSSSQIKLTWTAAGDDAAVTAYLVERCQGSGCTPFTQVASTGATAFSDAGLLDWTLYSYRVRASDAAGNLGPYSNVASARTPFPDTTPPGAPGALAATTVSSSQINLAWTAATDDVGVTGYLIERCQGAGCSAFAQIGTAAAL